MVIGLNGSKKKIEILFRDDQPPRTFLDFLDTPRQVDEINVGLSFLISLLIWLVLNEQILTPNEQKG